MVCEKIRPEFNNVEKRKFTDRLLKLPFTGIYTKTQNLTKLKGLGHDLGSTFQIYFDIFFMFKMVNMSIFNALFNAFINFNLMLSYK